MTKNLAKMIFEKYNPAGGIVRCPSDREKMREPLDTYAKAAVNLYGIIKRDEFVEIFNAQNKDQTTADEVYTILLPNVLQSGLYGFYKDYIVHHDVLHDFDLVEYLKGEQADKPRYIPPREIFLLFASEEGESTSHWQNLQEFLWDAFGHEKRTEEAFFDIKKYSTQKFQIKELGAIMDKHNLVFSSEKQGQEFFDLLALALNNTHIWENKGHSPNEMTNLFASRRSKRPTIHHPKKVKPNQPCPCGSGKKYKKCCALIEKGKAAQLSYSECKLFYETWYKLLDFVNQKLNVVNYKFSLKYQDYHDELLLLKIREKIWENPQIIGEFLRNTGNLSDEAINLLQSWEKYHVRGQFALVKYEPEYAILMRMDEDKASNLYAVKGMTTSIAEAMHRQLPVMLQTVLLPFGDKITYDSFMAGHAIQFSDGIRDMFEEEYLKSKEEYGIVLKLGDVPKE
jgi:uncharacterized protein YecA (UPF0149 family)